MPLKFKYKAKEEIPAEHQSFYVERDGAFLLDAEGAVDKTKLDEFRNTNVALLKQLEDLKKRYEGIDPEQVQALAEEKRRLEEQQQIKAGELEKVVEGRVKTVRVDLEKRIESLTTERDTLNARLTTIQIDQGVITAATKRGIRPTAISDILSRARNVFRLVNGVPAAFEGDSKTPRYGRDGVSPMSLEEWIDTQVSEAPHLFESNAGGGAPGNGSGGVGKGPVKNPFKRGPEWNLTEQMRLHNTDPGLAARLRAAAK